MIARRLAIISFRLNPSMATWTVVSRSSFGEDSSYRGRHSQLSTKNILKTLNGCPSSFLIPCYRCINRLVRERLYMDIHSCRIMSCILKFSCKCFDLRRSDWIMNQGQWHSESSLSAFPFLPFFPLIRCVEIKYFLH